MGEDQRKYVLPRAHHHFLCQLNQRQMTTLLCEAYCEGLVAGISAGMLVRNVVMFIWDIVVEMTSVCEGSSAGQCAT